MIGKDIKRVVLFVCITFLLSANGWSQSTSRSNSDQTIISNWSRLGIDFEVKDLPQPDQSLIVMINLNEYEGLRLPDTDVEVNDLASGYTLIIYSNNKTILRKTDNPLFNNTDFPNTNKND